MFTRGIGILFLISTVLSQSIDYPDSLNPSSNQRFSQPGFNNLNNPNQLPNQNQNRLLNQNQNQLQNQYQNRLGSQSQIQNSPYGVTQNPLVGSNNTFLGVSNSAVNISGPGPVQDRAYVRVQLRSYSDPGFKVSQTQLCQCPTGTAGDACINSSPQKQGYHCFFSFMVVVASTSPDVLYSATPFVLVDYPNGQVNPTGSSDFQQMFEFNTAYRPTGISILVSHSGAVINMNTGSLDKSDGITNVDRFSIPFDNNTQYNQAITTTATGETLGTSLQLSYTVGCKSPLVGPGCSLQCNSSSVNSQIAICQDVDTGYYAVCRWQNGNSNVQNCQNCPWGIKDNSYCVDANGNMLESPDHGVVSSGYKTATIVLGIVAGILFLLLALILIISICVRRRNNPNYSSRAPGVNRNTEFRGGHSGNAETTPLHSANNRPVPSPRNGVPQFTQKQPKPIIRPYYPPAAHIGGDPNETLNSSFATSQSPMNVSRSADV